MSYGNTQGKTLLRKMLITTAIVSVIAPSSVWAQDQNSEERRSMVLDEIVVTAQKRSENITDVPISVTSVSQKPLQIAG